MYLIDTHCHIYLEEFDKDRPEMIDRARKANVARILMPAIDTGSHKQLLAVEEAYPETCFAMMGLHPCSVKENFKEEIAAARSFFETRNFIAVGETGLDFYWDKTFVDLQYEAFQMQMDWALEFDIPVVIHSRNSTDECIKEVQKKQDGKLKGVFHCFGGSAEQAKQITDMGFYLGIGGVLTYKNAGLDILLANIDLSCIILETDAPYLAPVPYRGKRNENAYLKIIGEKLAEVKNTSLEDVTAITSQNAKALFCL